MKKALSKRAPHKLVLRAEAIAVLTPPRLSTAVAGRFLGHPTQVPASGDIGCQPTSNPTTSQTSHK